MMVRNSCHLWAIYAPGLIGTRCNYVLCYTISFSFKKNLQVFKHVFRKQFKFSSQQWALYSSVGLLPDSRRGDTSQVLQSESTFVSVSLETLITCFSKGKSIVISLSSKCLWKEKELKKTLRPGVSCRQAWNNNKGESGKAYKSNTGMLKLGVPASKWKMLQKVVENERAG